VGGTVGDIENDSVADGVTEVEVEEECVRDWVGAGVTVIVCEPDSDVVAVRETVGENVGAGEMVTVRDGESVCEPECVIENVKVRVGNGVGVGGIDGEVVKLLDVVTEKV